jgi:deoxyribonuclease V
MILAVDVGYRENHALAAGVAFQNWEAAEPNGQWVVSIANVAAYEPGQFYRRELPCILALLGQIDSLPQTILIDGYVYLGADRKPGLGKHLYAALGGKCAVIGVAKTRFRDTPAEAEVYRGDSRRPLYVTAVGVDEADARSAVMRMHGAYRLPEMLRRADRLSKAGEPGPSSLHPPG